MGLEASAAGPTVVPMLAPGVGGAGKGACRVGSPVLLESQGTQEVQNSQVVLRVMVRTLGKLSESPKLCPHQ